VEQDAFREWFALQQREGLGALAELSTPSARLDRELAALLAAGGNDHEIGSRFLWFDINQRGGVHHQRWALEGHPAEIAAFRKGLQAWLHAEE
jgi:hypothetical protein